MGVFVGNNNVAKSSNKLYVGVNGVARKVTAGYVGVNGVARKFYSAGPVYPQIVNYNMFYDYGEEFTSLTGGWAKTYSSGSDSKMSFQKNADNIYIWCKGSEICAGTENAIDTTDYVLAGIYWHYNKNHQYYCFNRFACGTIKAKKMQFLNQDGCVAVWSNQDKLPLDYTGIRTIDVSGVNQSVYYQFNLQSNQTNQECYDYGYSCFLCKADDWQTLASKAGITASSIDDVLNQSSTLLANEDAVQFMICQCTGDFMVNAVLNSTFLTALNSSSYKTVINANSHWSKFLAMAA